MLALGESGGLGVRARGLPDYNWVVPWKGAWRMGLCSAVGEERQGQGVHHPWGYSAALIAGMGWSQYAAAATPVAVEAVVAVEGMKEPHSAGWEPAVIDIHTIVAAPYIHQIRHQ